MKTKKYTMTTIIVPDRIFIQKLHSFKCNLIMIHSFVLIFVMLLIQNNKVFGQTVETFNSSTSWICPAGVTSLQVECWGGGGAGGGGASGGTGKSGSGGAGGSYVKNTSVTVIPGTTYTITVGAGGAPGGSSSTVPANPGSLSSFSGNGITTINAVGGAAGTWGSSATPSVTVLGTTTGNSGYTNPFNYSGGNGVAGLTGSYTGGGGAAAGSNGTGGNGIGSATASQSIPGTGGGAGAAGVTATATNGLAGNAPGGGGSGGWGSTSIGKAGGAGGAGRVVLTYTSGPVYPKWTAGWPAIDATSHTAINLKVNINSAGNVYYVVLANGVTAPTSVQVKAGLDAMGSPLNNGLSGIISCVSPSTEYISAVTGLSESLTYDVYFVGEDAVPNLQPNPMKVTITMGSSSKIDQAISFDPIPGGTIGDPDFNSGAASNSDLIVTIMSSDTTVAKTYGDNIHIVGIGTTIITASQAGDDTYNPANNVNQSFTVVAVSKKNQTISFPSFPIVTVGNADFSPGATSDSGLPVTLSSSNTAVATIVNGNIHIVGSGIAIITASQAGNTQYNAADDFAQELTVNPAAKLNQTITFPTLPNVNEGDADFNPGATTDAIPTQETDPNLFLNANRFSAVTISTVQYATVTNSSGNLQNLSLDVYEPTGDTSINRPCMLWIHGGSFTSNNKSSQSYIVNYATAFAERGFVCISIDYRLRSSASTLALKWPALQDAARDGNTALDWIRAHAATYRIDTNSLFICGGSAGGQTAVSLSQFTGPDSTAKYTPEIAYKNKLWNKQGIIACGIFWGAEEAELRGWTYPYLSTTSIPSIQIHGSADTTIPVQNAYDLQAAFNAAGVTNELHIIQGAAHSPSGTTYDPNNLMWSGNFFVNEWKKVIPSGAHVITYTSSNPNVATIINGNIHIVGAGTTTITASQAGDSNYNSAQVVSQTLTVNGNTTTDLTQNNQHDFSIYPNPLNSGTLKINLSGYQDKDFVISISTIQGQVIFNLKYGNQNTSEISLNPDLPKGIYFITAKSDNSNISKKLIVE